MLKSPLLRWLILLIFGWFVIVVFGIFANQELLMAPGWWQGLACGVGMAWVWMQSKTIRTMGQVFGLALLVSISLGLIGSPQFQARAFFQSLSIGFPAGFIAIGLLLWKRTYLYLLEFAQSSGDVVAVRFVERFRPKS